MPYDDLEFVNVQDYREMSTLLSDSTMCTGKNDVTYVPSEGDLYDSDTDSECSNNDDLILGPTVEHAPLFHEEMSDEEDEAEDVAEIRSIEGNHPLIRYRDQIMQLARMVPPKICPICHADQFLCNETIVGSSLRLKWNCV